MTTDVNSLRESLGDATGITVRSAKKYLMRSGLELVPQRPPLGELHARVFYRGTECARLDPIDGGWTYEGARHRFSTLAGGVLYVACAHIETAKPR